MKHYQDTVTGQVYAFSEHDNVEKLIQTRRNIPKTLTSKIKEKPSDNHIWYNGDWINKKDKPIDYKEHISEIPSYDPAWITFLFEPLVIISKNKNDFVVSLDDINTNLYDTRILSKFVAKLKDYDKNSQLDILLTYDGSLSLPIDRNYNTPEKAVDKFNEIIGALFLGGTLVKPIDLTKLSQGCIVENGGSNFSYTSSFNNDFRNKSVSKKNRIKAHHPSHIQIECFIGSYSFGMSIINKIDFSPIFLALGFHYLNQGKAAESLSNLWIVIEQLVNYFLLKMRDVDRDEVFKVLQITQAEKMIMKLKVLKLANILTEKEYDFLDNTRDVRNHLLHKGKVPSTETVVELWDTLLKLLEISINTKLNKLQANSKIVLGRNLESQIKNITPKKTNFEQWKKDGESLI